MALLAIKQLQVRAVGVHAIQVDRVVAGMALPAAEHDLPIVEHRRIQVVALVERDLADVVAVFVHDVQVERELVVVLVDGRERALALVEQQRLRLRLPRRREDDTAVREILRHDVVADLRRQGRRYDPNEFTGLERVLPDIPRRHLVVHVDVRVERVTHGKQQATAVIVDLDVTHGAETLRQLPGDVDRLGADSCAIAEVQVRPEVERDLLPEVLLLEHAVVVHGQRRLDVGDGKVDDDRVRILAGADLHAVALAARAGCNAQRRQRGCPRRLRRNACFESSHQPVHRSLPLLIRQGTTRLAVLTVNAVTKNADRSGGDDPGRDCREPQIIRAPGLAM